MKAVIQRVSKADITIDHGIHRSISYGAVILLGVHKDDTESEVELLAKKAAGLRIFSDDDGKMNLSASDINGDILIVSNFTLFADCSHGRRPSFFESARPDKGNELYKAFVDEIKGYGFNKVETGEFGADMQIDMCCDGPVTIIIDTDDLK